MVLFGAIDMYPTSTAFEGLLVLPVLASGLFILPDHDHAET